MAETRTHEWQRLGWREEVLTDPTGRVIGRISGTWRTYYANADTLALGEYVSIGDARMAVEKALELSGVRYVDV